ncbi:hypothetical protein ACQ4OC_15575 [Yersinia sp. J1]|uniref:hypothetical protein n=1 Tax=Yersinia sp. J1 TaxID=3424774 RepID=UPI003D35EC94
MNNPVTENAEPNWLVKLANGQLSIGRTYLHLILALAFIAVITISAGYANWDLWAILIGMALYAIYIFNVGLGLWRVSKKINNAIAITLTKLVSVIAFFCGISSIINSIKLATLYLK